MNFSDSQVRFFRSLFRGREDVYAKRWESQGKSGYSPAYNVDRNDFERHKALGGSFKDYPGKTYAPLDDSILRSHLSGAETIGIYPLMPDSTSWFLAIDFDEGDWQKDISNLYKHCAVENIPAYIERSRSGNGGHCWIFFEAPYPASKIRTIGFHLLHEAGISNKSANKSFDRMFPNQDFHSGKGLGHLIALPFQGKSILSGNTGFLDPVSLAPIEDYWHYINAIKRISVVQLDEIWKRINNLHTSPVTVLSHHDGINIILDNCVTVGRNNLPPDAVTFLRERLKISNPNYFIKKASGKNTYGLPSSETLLTESTADLSFPRGFIGPFLRYCRQRNLVSHMDDQRLKLPETTFQLTTDLRDYQRSALDAVLKKDFGFIVLPPGSGKTIVGLGIIAARKQPALIIIHRRQLFDQWIERIQSFLGIPRFKIGRISGGKYTIGDQVTVAMVQSLNAIEDRARINYSFGLILVDECHHVPSPTYRDVLAQLHTTYLYGLTATPIRKNKDEQFIYHQLGDLIHEIPPHDNQLSGKEVVINIRDTDLQVPFNEQTDDVETLLKILVHDSERNALISDDVVREVNRNRSVLVLTERKAHLDVLNQYLKRDVETIVLSGDDTQNERKRKMSLVAEGRFQVLITTGQFLGEGIDMDTLDCLILAFPCSFEGKLKQYFGRVQRTDEIPVIYDYRDLQISYLEKMFQQRNQYYSRLKNMGLMRAQEEYSLRFEGDRFYIGSNTNAHPIDVLKLDTIIQAFKPGVVWRIKILKYDDAALSALVEILDYNSDLLNNDQQIKLSFLSISEIRFNNIDTTGLLRSVIFKQTQPNHLSPEIEHSALFEKSIRVSFKKLQFADGVVKVPYYFSAIRKDIILEISNNDIRREFEAVKDYFAKMLKVKAITVAIKIKYNKEKWRITSIEATSDEISAINESMIESVRFEFVKNRFIKSVKTAPDKDIQTFDQMKDSDESIQGLIEDEQELLNQLLKVDNARHYLQLKHISTLHEFSILKLRFVLQPFSFIFLLAGERMYHIIWETLDTEEATYIWHVEKSKGALRATVDEIQSALAFIRKNGRNEYVNKMPLNFSRIFHDYTDRQRGFVVWKGELDERIV